MTTPVQHIVRALPTTEARVEVSFWGDRIVTVGENRAPLCDVVQELFRNDVYYNSIATQNGYLLKQNAVKQLYLASDTRLRERYGFFALIPQFLIWCREKWHGHAALSQEIYSFDLEIAEYTLFNYYYPGKDTLAEKKARHVYTTERVGLPNGTSLEVVSHADKKITAIQRIAPDVTTLRQAMDALRKAEKNCGIYNEDQDIPARVQNVELAQNEVSINEIFRSYYKVSDHVSRRDLYLTAKQIAETEARNYGIAHSKYRALPAPLFPKEVFETLLQEIAERREAFAEFLKNKSRALKECKTPLEAKAYLEGSSSTGVSQEGFTIAELEQLYRAKMELARREKRLAAALPK